MIFAPFDPAVGDVDSYLYSSQAYAVPPAYVDSVIGVTPFTEEYNPVRLSPACRYNMYCSDYGCGCGAFFPADQENPWPSWRAFGIGGGVPPLPYAYQGVDGSQSGWKAPGGFTYGFGPPCNPYGRRGLYGPYGLPPCS